MKFKYSFLALAVASSTMLSGCGDGPEMDKSLLVAESLPENSKAAFSSLKNIPDAAVDKLDRAYAQFAHRTAIADYLLANDYVEDVEIKLSLLEARNNQLLKHHTDKVIAEQVNDQAIEAYYEANRHEFEEKSAELSHILVRVTPRMNEEQIQQREIKINNLYDRLEKGKVDFQSAVQSYSDDKRTIANGGSLGELRIGSLELQIQEGIRELAIDEYSKPIRTKSGFEIYKLDKAVSSEVKPFSEVKAQVAYRLKQKIQFEEVERLKELITN